MQDGAGRSGDTFGVAPRLIDLLSAAAAEPGLRKGERTRRRVLWASAVALEQTAFAQLSMDRIAEIAEVSRGALYQYVASKEEAARLVLLALQELTLTMPTGRSGASDPFEAILRTNRYYVGYFEKNAVFMERVRELRETLPELIAERQKVNRRWAERVMSHVVRHRRKALDPVALRLRVVALECMIDDVLRELFVIRNPDLLHAASDREALVQELSLIWYKALYVED
ncbi:TetR/AcrR family transcriptional regulator [uncultured Bosea sp.]|uniref:TetR/AcrR family transcriptional regulator n=1 Tax=uncultured Bosea sp. TaxID=211457 RepID=UPI0025DE6350|nr:TetR/AcrR family transcriptional regulator [uncultured Bosea sp.]